MVGTLQNSKVDLFRFLSGIFPLYGNPLTVVLVTSCWGAPTPVGGISRPRAEVNLGSTVLTVAPIQLRNGGPDRWAGALCATRTLSHSCPIQNPVLMTMDSCGLRYRSKLREQEKRGRARHGSVPMSLLLNPVSARKDASGTSACQPVLWETKEASSDVETCFLLCDS